jgi:UDP-N-acetylmuramate dehydrogenase
MITIQENVDLRSLNTFGIRAKARYFVSVISQEQLSTLFHHDLFRNSKRLILGGGSNILFTSDFDGLVILNQLRGFATVRETDDTVWLSVASGENWHNLVMHCVNHNYGGIENLSLIPGTVGAAPMQNIGAYGVELGEVIESVDAVDIHSGEKLTFPNKACLFGYRESIFKQELKEKIFISSITLRLSKKNHRLRLDYGAIQETLRALKITQPTLRDVSRAVIQIRSSKLPDPAVLGNAGSFFKNPSVPETHYQSLKFKYPKIPGYTTENQLIKVPAGWLIEQCGWKGLQRGFVGVHQQQALVLVNTGNATGADVLQLAHDIQASVLEKFNITLVPEVNIV